MPRKSPRARRRPDPGPRLPSAARPRATPGRTRAAGRAAAAGGHASKGARGTAAAPPKRARRPAAGGAKRAVRAPRAAPPAPSSGARAAVARTARPARPTGKPAAPKRPLRRPRPPRRPRFAPPEPARVAAILAALDRAHPDARCALDFASPMQLLVATILSAQCTDERVNKVTPGLFARWPDAAALAAAAQDEVEEAVRSTGFFRMKARAIREAAADIVAKHGGEVPRTLEALTALRGVGRKTANVVLGNAFGVPGLVVDTHVTRLANRLGLTNESDAVKIEFALMPVVPRERWTLFSHWLILHGRRVCNARKPRCSACPLAPHCPRLGVTASA